MMLRVALGVPEHFVPKAQYAIGVLLAPYGVEPAWVDIDDVKAHGGLYYGVLPYPDIEGDGKVVAIESLPQTWEYFERRDRYNPTQAYFIDYPGRLTIPVLFGSAGIDEVLGNTKLIRADIIASAFFWLSDWQDVTRQERDSHGRQPFSGSLQQHLMLHNRAVVDEYGEILASVLDGVVTLRSKCAARVVFSHDIDRIRKKTAGIAVRESLDYLILNRRKEGVMQRINRWGKSMRQLVGKTDAYEASILRIMDEHRSRGNKASILFKSVINRHIHDANDYLSQPFFEIALGRAKANQLEIGYHSGYEAGGDPDQLRAEYGRLCNRVGQTISAHRSHYLRYQEGVTFRTLEELGITVDSSVAWAEQTGFRAQTCHPYPLYDISLNRALRVIEIPLSVMDTQPFGYMKLSAEEAIADARSIWHTVNSHGGIMVWNFHHHIFDALDAPGWQDLFISALDMSSSSTITTFESIHDTIKFSHD